MDRDLGWVVLKFGGTSVATAERWAIIAGRVERRLAEGRRPLVVCSALAGVSNRLEEMLALAVAGRHWPRSASGTCGWARRWDCRPPTCCGRTSRSWRGWRSAPRCWEIPAPR